MRAGRWVASIAGSLACGACATAVEFEEPPELARHDAGSPMGADRDTGGSAGSGSIDVHAPPPPIEERTQPRDASTPDRVDEPIDERPAIDERPVIDDRPALDERPAVRDSGPPGACPDCVLRVRYRAGDTNATDNQIKPQFDVANAGSSAVPLAELTLRYWLSEGSTPQMFFCDYAKLGASSIVGRFGEPAMPRPGADRYLEIGFAPAAGSLSPGSATGEIQARCQKADYSPYQEADDYSFDPAATAFADAPRVTLYRQGVLVWGVEP
jgi:hypothetical protein